MIAKVEFWIGSLVAFAGALGITGSIFIPYLGNKVLLSFVAILIGALIAFNGGQKIRTRFIRKS